jgi:hypothetical protein
MLRGSINRERAEEIHRMRGEGKADDVVLEEGKE